MIAHDRASALDPKLLASILLRSPRSIGLRSGVGVALRVLAGSQMLELRLPGYPRPILARGDTSDLHVFEKVFVREEYRCFLPEARRIVDLGANVGYAALYFAQRYPEARVIAVEPDPANYALLRRNTAVYPQVVPLQAAVWSRRTHLRITNPDDASWSRRVAEQPGDGLGGVPAITMAELLALCGDEPIDILKIDIESAEKELFDDPAAAWLDRVHVIIIELHDNLRPGCSAAFYRALSRRRFNQYIIGENIVVVQDQTAD
ncbi:MAG: hypothetical protein OHK0022_53200 [Roseiflexaceae bacterium]